MIAVFDLLFLSLNEHKMGVRNVSLGIGLLSTMTLVFRLVG